MNGIAHHSGSWRVCLVLAVSFLLVAPLSACKNGGSPRETGKLGPGKSRSYCPAELPAPPLLPFERPEHSALDFWLSRTNAPEKILIDHVQLAAENARISTLNKDGWPVGRWNLLHRPVDQPALDARFEEKVKKLRDAIANGKRLLAGGAKPRKLAETIVRRMREAKPISELRLARVETPIRCYPTATPMYDAPWSVAFDLMQCAQLRAGEMVRVVRHGPRYWYIWSSYTEGWVDHRALSAPISEAMAQRHIDAEDFVVVTRDRVALRAKPGGGLKALLRWGLRLPVLDSRPGWIKVAFAGATTKDKSQGWLPAEAAHRGYLPLTRAALFRAGFSQLDAPYGWGGMGGHRDCSRLLMDLFGLFGLGLPRNSWHQSNATDNVVDVDKLDEQKKVAAIEAAAKRGVVLLYLPGHIGLYIGRDGDHLYALHQFSGYLRPCPGGGETMYRANRTAVTSLELGRGSSRRAFIERITRLVVIGQPLATSKPVSNSK